MFRATVSRQMQRGQSILQRRLRERNLHLRKRQSMQFSVQSASLPRDLRRQHHVQRHVRQRTVCLRRRQHVHVHLFGVPLPLDLRGRRRLRGFVPGWVGGNPGLRHRGVRGRRSGDLSRWRRDHLWRALSLDSENQPVLGCRDAFRCRGHTVRITSPPPMLSPRAAGLSRSRTIPWILARAAFVAWTLFPMGRAGAVPIDDPHVGGIGFSGPTTGDLAAVYWNPAALGLISGPQLMFAGIGTNATTTVARAPIDATGVPGSGTSFTDVRASDRSHPFIWPPGPGAFAGFGTPIGGDRFTLAVATYMPFVDRSRYQAPAGEVLATRYHRISSDLRNLALVPALAVRFMGDLRVGFAPGVLFSTGRLSFVESTCVQTGTCAGEDPAGDATLDLGSNQGILSSTVSFTLAAGVYYRRRAWEFGLSFSSRPLGADVSGAAVIAGDKSKITAPGGTGVTCGNQNPVDGSNCLFADIAYKLPNTWTAAVAWHPRPGWEIAAIGRILTFPGNDVIDIRLTGSVVSEAGVPSHIVLQRGYGTVIDTRLRAAYWLGERIRIGGGLRVETSALPDRSISPAALDGRKMEPTVMVLLRPMKHVWVGAGYGFTYMFPVTATTSAFDPTAAAGCVAAGGNLDADACIKRNQGLARPTAAGTYNRMSHAFGLSITAQF